MRKKLILLSFVFWWAVMFPLLNFTEKEIVDLNNNNIEIKCFLAEMLH